MHNDPTELRQLARCIGVLAVAALDAIILEDT
jgi:hypothetical protein